MSTEPAGRPFIAAMQSPWMTQFDGTSSLAAGAGRAVLVCFGIMNPLRTQGAEHDSSVDNRQ